MIDIEKIGILAKLELSETEKEKAKQDIEQMLDYIEQMNELNTENVEIKGHVIPIFNVFREDIVKNGDDKENLLKNAPKRQQDYFCVPKTLSGK